MSLHFRPCNKPNSGPWWGLSICWDQLPRVTWSLRCPQLVTRGISRAFSSSDLLWTRSPQVGNPDLAVLTSGPLECGRLWNSGSNESAGGTIHCQLPRRGHQAGR